MASEIRVNKITHTAGVGTITTNADGIVVAGIVTANNFSGAVTGSGANLTSIPAGQLTGTVADARLSTVSSSKLSGALPALDGSALTGVGASFGNSSVNTSGIITATSFVPTTGQLSHRNIVVNGDMRIAQRGTSSTSSGIYSVDRFGVWYHGTNEAPTQAQVDVSSGTTPYTNGFRKALKITNGNQTGGAGATDWVWVRYLFEAQDIANSGWNYTSSSSYVTLSFWIKSSVAQTFKGYLRSRDGTEQRYAFETGSLTADTWTKIVKTIPGNSNLQFDNDANQGFQLNILGFMGTDYTDSSVTEDVWAAYASGTRMKDNTSTWYTTNDATLEITGFQLEVGPEATAFEHLSYGEELRLCQRYYQGATSVGAGYGSADGYARAGSVYAVVMRASPTLTTTNTASGSIIASGTSGSGFYVTYGSLGGSSAGIFTFAADAEL